MDTREAFEKWYKNTFEHNRTICGAYQAATDAAHAEYLPVIEKLVGALTVAQEAAECFPDVHDGRVEPPQIIEHLHEWEAKYITFGQIVGAEKALALAAPLMGEK